MRVESRSLSDQAELMAPFEVPAPDGNGHPTLRDLIELSLRHGSGRFARRRGEHALAETLNAEGEDTAAALQAAIHAFADGVYIVMIDGVSHRDLDAEIAISPRSTISFVRLVEFAER